MGDEKAEVSKKFATRSFETQRYLVELQLAKNRSGNEFSKLGKLKI